MQALLLANSGQNKICSLDIRYLDVSRVSKASFRLVQWAHSWVPLLLEDSAFCFALLQSRQSYRALLSSCDITLVVWKE